MIPAGVLPAVPDVDELTKPRHIGVWLEACDLLPGYHVQLGDGRWAEVVGHPVLASLGRVVVDVSWLGGPAECASWGWKRVVWARTPVLWAAYMAAVEAQLEGMAK